MVMGEGDSVGEGRMGSIAKYEVEEENSDKSMRNENGGVIV